MTTTLRRALRWEEIDVRRAEAAIMEEESNSGVAVIILVAVIEEMRAIGKVFTTSDLLRGPARTAAPGHRVVSRSHEIRRLGAPGPTD